MVFKDRFEAGQMLAQKLPTLRDPIVLAIPRGGVQVGAALAKSIKAPLDIIVSRKLGAPENPELAIGAVTSDGALYLDQELIMQLDVSNRYLRQIKKHEQREAIRREQVYRKRKSGLSLRNKEIVVTDDGIATGATMIAVIRKLKNSRANKIILAVPVLGAESRTNFSKKVDKLIYLHAPESFYAVGQFYARFNQVSDREVIKLLRDKTV